MKINPNSNSINAQQLSKNAFPNRISRNAAAQKLGINTESIKLDDVELTLSRRAQSALTVVGDVNSMLHKQEFEEFTHPDLIFSGEFSNEALSFMSRIQFSLGFAQKSGNWELMLQNEGAHEWLVQNADVADMGARLVSGSGIWDESSMSNMNVTGDAAINKLANRYAEMRSSLEERYTGEELETMLGRLSDAFDLVASHIAHGEAESARMRLDTERIWIRLHNAMNSAGVQSNVFAKDYIEYDEEQKRNISNTITDMVRETTVHFAQMTRDFVLENGAIRDESALQLLTQFLQSAEPSEGRFSFNDLQTLNDIRSDHRESNRERTLFQDLHKRLDLLG